MGLAKALLARGGRLRGVIVTRGASGALVVERQAGSGIRAWRLRAPPAEVANVNGAGDALVAGALRALAAGAGLADAVSFGMAAAKQAVE